MNLTGYQYAELRFWTKWSTEPTWDFATVELSTNNGSTWTALRSKLSHSGSGRSGSKQPTGTWGYESYTPGLTWLQQQIDLSAYINQQVKLRFRLASDGREQRDGFYVDDIRLLGYVTNSDTGLPPVPLLASPANGATGQSSGINFLWHTSTGAQSYRLQVATDSLFSSLIVNDSTLTDTGKFVGFAFVQYKILLACAGKKCFGRERVLGNVELHDTLNGATRAKSSSAGKRSNISADITWSPMEYIGSSSNVSRATCVRFTLYVADT